MTVEHVDLARIAPQPWKNGAGLTREIASGGRSSADFDWRFSVAEVARDAPFSAFPGIDRCIVLLRGAGLLLRSADGAVEQALVAPHTPLRFAGDTALDATLVDGPCIDFNVMTRRGVFRSDVVCVRQAGVLRAADVTLLLACAGDWRVTTDEARMLAPMQAMLWREPTASLRITPRVDAGALLVVRLCHDRPS